MKKSIPLAALIGVTGVAGLASVADAAPVAATLVSVTSYSPNGSAAWNGTADTSTWTFDAASSGQAAAAVTTGGSYSRLTKAGSTPLMRHNMTGVTLGSGAATGTTWACIEGTFGGGGTNTGGVGASICGNYNFGANKTNESTYTPTTVGATVSFGGDDAAIGPAQSLATSYSGMTVSIISGAVGSLKQFCLSNSNATDPAGKCAGGGGATAGYDFLYTQPGNLVPAPPAVWLLGTGLAGLIARRLRKQKTA
jgi:hypothetical protein